MKKDIPIGELVLNKLKEDKLTVAWLAKKIYTDPSNLRKKLKKDSMHTSTLTLISKVLQFNFFQYYNE
jgi:hypothetical protein